MHLLPCLKAGRKKRGGHAIENVEGWKFIGATVGEDGSKRSTWSFFNFEYVCE